SGRGVARLRRAGLRVDAGCLMAECRHQNRTFFTWIRNKRPWVTLKAAATLDGCIGDRQEKHRPGNQRWITGNAARQEAHALRAQHDAVLIGVGTLLADNPRLTVRSQGKANKAGGEPLRIVLDSRLRTPPTSALLRQGKSTSPLVIATLPAKPDRGLLARRKRLEAAGAEVFLSPSNQDGRVDLAALLRWLAGREVQSLLVEGGSQIHGAFIAAGLVDSVAMFLAPRLVGSGVPVVEGPGLDWRKPAILGPISVRAIGEDVLLSADVVTRGQSRRS
ncbi:MAG TPA: bifunctional diaminohydroxyphosphoribosylaminopyrimidine deaminase/5-amino-6-(5-phosphoribosylamino)uracil reductase RibD, partial [Polyangia bacterium]